MVSSNKFYQLVAADCNDMMSVNLYVTGLIMYYAGQLTYKLRMELERADVPPVPSSMPPTVKIVFAGKGARIFDWFPAVNENAAKEYYNQMFLTWPRGDGKCAEDASNPLTSPNGKIVAHQRGYGRLQQRSEIRGVEGIGVSNRVLARFPRSAKRLKFLVRRASRSSVRMGRRLILIGERA